MGRITIAGKCNRSVILKTDNNCVDWVNLMGLSGTTESNLPECRGMFFLDADVGRFESDKWSVEEVMQGNNTLTLVQKADVFNLHMTFAVDEETGAIRWSTKLENMDNKPHILYSCLPRVSLQGAGYRIYSQYSAWCAENQGDWADLHAGDLVLTNSNGCSAENCTPFACLQSKATGMSVAFHIIPIGDWLIRARRLAGHRTSYTVMEMGLSDANLRLSIKPQECLDLPEIIFYAFDGAVENCCEPIQRYLLKNYGHDTLPELVYNTWFFDFDVLEIDRLKEQAVVAKELGCKTFVVDAGWFGTGTDWENQVGNWEECRERAFCGQMKAFSDYIRSLGMGFGLWMEPERAGSSTKVFQEHPEWFLPSDAIIFDLTQDCVIEYLAEQVTHVVQKYGAVWMKLDYNTNMLRDITGENFYRFYLGERKFMDEICRRNPTCSFEGCSGGGRRTDFRNVMTSYHGHMLSDSVHPIEVLRMRQNTCPRLLPTYIGAWLVMQEVPFPRGTYFNHDCSEQTKVLYAGDGWWEQTVDVSSEFALAANLLGEWGISGDIASLSARTRAQICQAAEFYENHRRFLARSICHPLTALAPIDENRGWVVEQCENVDGKGSLIFAFRMVDDIETFYAYPKNLYPNMQYTVRISGKESAVTTGEILSRDGIPITCAKRFQAHIIELIPAQADQKKQ